MDSPLDTHGSNPAQPRARAEVVLDIEADPARVWAALTTGPGLEPWMGEGAAIDPRPGGLVALPDPVGGVTRRGRVDRIDEGHRLDFTWWPALGPARRTTVSITVSSVVTETGPRSRVRVVEAPVSARAEVGRLPVGLWSWRLALLSLTTSLSRI